MKISIVAPVYNEEECLEEFFRKTLAVAKTLEEEVEWIFVDDGSHDRSPEILNGLHREDSRVKVLVFSRNFGHQPAIKAGIDHATGDAVITIDADLQDPPEAIPDMIAKWKEGFDVVYAVRAERKGESFFKKTTASLYYRLMKRLTHIDMPLDTGDFRLISRPVADVLKQMTEKRPFLRGLISWLGFRQTGILITREARFAGKTKFSLLKMLQFAWSGITHFSFFPMHVATWIGLLTFVYCTIELIHTLYVSLVLKIAVPGWASLMVAILFLGSVQLITLGILGSYLARNYDESRNRPLYLIQKKEGF
ncbi:MAG TPA: glycosyltransferase family 2 protein [Candidatus Omnitrophota bacterium]|nr:glycosyltransferase family 2 protein [Candidatus Omnitrophota bacterium]